MGNLPFSNLQNSVPLNFILFRHLTRFSIFSTNFKSTTLRTFSKAYAHKMMKLFLKKFFLAALFSAVLSQDSFHHGRCWKLKVWCISDTFFSILEGSFKFLYHGKYSSGYMLFKPSTLQQTKNVIQILIFSLPTKSALFISSYIHYHYQITWKIRLLILVHQTYPKKNSRRLHFF